MTIDSIFYFIWTGLLVFVFVSWIKGIKAEFEKRFKAQQEEIYKLKKEIKKVNRVNKR